MAKSYTFRITSEGVDKLRKELEALGPAGKQVFDTIAQTTPKLASGMTAAEERTRKVREELEKLSVQARATESVVDRINRVTGVSASAMGDRASDVAAYGEELDRLRARYNPLFAAQQRHRRELEDIAHAERIGAISANEAAQARARAAVLTGQAAVANDELARSHGRGSQAMQQFSYQFSDVVSQIASGTDLTRALIQQGAQIAPMFLGGATALGAMAGALAFVVTQQVLFGDTVKAAADQARAFDDVMADVTKTVDDQADGIRKLVDSYNSMSAAQQTLARIKITAQLAETTKELQKQQDAFDDLLAKQLGAREFQTTAGVMPLSAVEIVKHGVPAFDLQQSPELADDPVVKLALQIKELRASGDFAAITDLLSKQGKAGRDAAEDLVETASGIDELSRRSEQAGHFLNLVERGLTKTAGSATAVGGAISATADALMRMASDRSWVEAAREGPEALRELAKQQAVLAAEAEVERALYAEALRDGMTTKEELANLARQVAEAGDIAAEKFDLENSLKGGFGLKEATAAAKVFADQMDDVNRFLVDQAGGITAAERAYQPFAAQIEKLEDLKRQEGLSTTQLTEIEQELVRLRLAGAVAMEDATAQIERQNEQRMAEIGLLEKRNDLLRQQLAGGRDGLKAGADLVQLEVQARIDNQVAQEMERLRKLQEQGLKIDLEAEEKRMRSALETQAALEKQLKTQNMANRAADRLGNVFTRLASGDMGAVAEGIGDLVQDFNALEAQTGSAATAFIELGKGLLQSTEAGNALGNALGEILGRSDAQNRNAQIGGSIGGSVGSLFGPAGKGIGSFLGNLVGGLFGPGNSIGERGNAAAGIDANGYLRATGAVSTDNKADPAAYRSLIEQTSGAINEVLATLGATLSSHLPGVSFGQQDGKYFYELDQSLNLDDYRNKKGAVGGYGSAEEAVAAAIKSIVDGGFIEGLDDLSGRVLERIAGKSLEDIQAALGDLSYMQEALQPFQEALGEFAQRMADNSAYFEGAIDAATRLGESTDLLRQRQEEAAAQIRGEFEQGVADRLLEQTDPTAFALLLVEREFAALRTEADAVSASMETRTQIEELYRRAVDEVTGAVEESATKVRSLAEIMRERETLETQLLMLQGNTAELRRREREALVESNRALYDQITALQDQQAAAQAAAEAAAKAAEAQQKLADMNMDLQERALRLVGRSGAADLFGFDRQRQSDRSAFQGIGGNLGWFDAVTGAERAQMVFDTARDAYVSAIDSQISILQAQLRLEEEQAQSTRDLVSGLRDAAGRLRQFRDGLLLSELSPMLPEAQLAEARRQLADAVTAARGGDVEAAGRVQDLVSRVLEISGDFYGRASLPYAQEFAAQQALLDQLSGTLDSRATIEERSLTQLIDLSSSAQEQIKQLQQLRADAMGLGQQQVASMDALRATMQASFASLTAALAGLSAALPAQLAGSGLVEPANMNDRAQHYLAANPDVAQAWDLNLNNTRAAASTREEWALKHYEIFGLSEGRAFADGGYASPGMALVGEEGPELVDFRAPARVYTADQTAAALRSGLSGDAETKRLLASAVQLLERLVGVTERDGDDVCERLDRVSGLLSKGAASGALNRSKAA